MSYKAVIIDYDMGNVASVQKALHFLNIENKLSSDHKDIENARYIILPGVGSFKQGMQNLIKRDLIDILHKEVIIKKKPFLGICIGMHLLATQGTEFGGCNGLGWIKGVVKQIEEPDKNLPHMGWNELHIKKSFFMNAIDGKDFYFIHSYHFDVEDSQNVVATFNYGKDYVAVIEKENILATQFHPEKSQKKGMELLHQFFTRYA
ncbi:MAG: imidazole glycerol phosphate synthase subunit HisH [Chitinophagaceae bacterium]|nr:imidazole glycerol phosphate synthase subunit HisH [Chitinophagaceae bacterium]